MRFKRRREPGEELRKYTCKGYKERDRTKNAWQAVEIVLVYEEGKDTDFELNYFKHRKHNQEAAVKGVCMFSAALNLRKNP